MVKELTFYFVVDVYLKSSVCQTSGDLFHYKWTDRPSVTGKIPEAYHGYKYIASSLEWQS